MAANFADSALPRIEPGRRRAHSLHRAPLALVAVGPLARAKPGLIRLRAVARADGALDFMWQLVNEAAERLLPCKAWQLTGRYMSEGRAGVFDHPVLAERYRRVIQDGLAQSFEQVHRIQDQQDLVIHHVSRTADGEGVDVMLINLSATRRTPRSLGAPPAAVES